jgi:arsenical resistance protein ArsH
VMQVSGGSQSFNAVNQLRVLSRWMRMFTIPNQSSVPKAFLEFDETDRMKQSSCPNTSRPVKSFEVKTRP